MGPFNPFGSIQRIKKTQHQQSYDLNCFFDFTAQEKTKSAFRFKFGHPQITIALTGFFQKTFLFRFDPKINSGKRNIIPTSQFPQRFQNANLEYILAATV